MTKFRVYLAGPMTGYDNYNYDAFFDLSRQLSCRGIDVVNPAQVTTDMGGQLKFVVDKVFAQEVISKQMEELSRCDAILLMDGWENSVGSKAELKSAIEHNLKIFQQNEISKLFSYVGSLDWGKISI